MTNEVAPTAMLAPVSRRDWQEIFALLDTALELDPASHPVWLEALGPDQVRLSPLLKELLRARAEVHTGDFMQSPATFVFANPAVRLGLAAQALVGPYRLLREIGQGGMASVWLAERADGLLERQVALKLPHASWGIASFADRMARERNILASLTHPNIARLYDAGIAADGRPFLALEYVDGQPIDAYATAHGLTVRERVGLIVQVARAVAHAHARLVVHRDLKPSNILVDAQGQAHLLDFGIAKLVDPQLGDAAEESQLTQAQGRALTPDYASPEQIRGEPIGTASDVYGLGVVAYELLAGVKPYQLKRQGAAALEEAIASADVRLASIAATSPSARHALKGDLDAILNRALKKDVADRYPTVEAFAQDIERYLANLPVQAQPDALGYRIRKFLLRNRLSVAAATVVTTAVVVGAGVALWQASVARTQAQLAEQALSRQEAVRQLYVETLSTVASWNAKTFARPGSVMQLLQSKLQELEPQYKGRPQELLGIMNAVSVQLNFAGDFEGSLNVGRKYLALLKATQADARRILFAYMTVGRALEHLGRGEESEAALREAMSWAPLDSDPSAQQARAMAATDLGRVLVRNGKRQEAEQVLSAAEAVAQRMFPADNDHFAIQQTLGRLHLGFDDPTALQYAQRAHAGYVATGTAESATLAESLGNLGAALLANGRLVDAEAALREAHRRCQDLYGSSDRDTVTNLGRLASALARQGKHATVRALLSERVAALQLAAAPDTGVALVTVRGRQLENEMLYGDLQAAAAFVGPADTSRLTQPDVRDADEYLILEARFLVWTGRGDEAVRRLTAGLQALKPGARSGPAGFRISVALVEARLAQARDGAGRSAAVELVNTMRAAGATRNVAYRTAVELAALATAREGAAGEALAILEGFDAVPAEEATPALSNIDRAESNIRRAQIYLAAERPNDAAGRVKAALAELDGQHPQSPRVTQAHRLATALHM